MATPPATRLKTPFGRELPLRRYPVRERDLLQAWDAADELLLEQLAIENLAEKRILIVGDTFGALGSALADFAPEAYTDSFLAARALAVNSKARIASMNLLSDLRGPYDLVVLRVPKNLSFLEDTLAHLGHCVKPGARLVAGFMVKYQAAGAFDLITQYFGETRTSLAKKKARLVFAEFARPPTESPYPKSVLFEDFTPVFVNHSNVFSRQGLDIGTRFFLEHLPNDLTGTLLDLGCANGIIGIAAKRMNPDLKVIFTDESKMALLSAETNFQAFFPAATAGTRFVWTNGYEDGEAASVDNVLCNPPFHQGGAVGDHIARQMFDDAHRVLRPGGRLRIVGNSHLFYGEILAKIFGNSKLVAKNAKFSVIDAIRR